MSQAHSLMAYTTHKNCKIGDGGSFVFFNIPTLRTDPVVCPDCNIEGSLSLNMRREIAKNTAYTQCIRSIFCFRIRSFQGFRVLGL